MGRSLRGQYSGVVRYTHELVTALAPRIGRDLTVFVTQAPDGIEDLGVNRVRAPFPTPNEYARAAWEQAVVPLEVSRLQPDVYHSPNYILPLALRRPAVVTVHDLFYLEPDLHRLRSRLYLTALATHAISSARRVICVSNSTGDRLLRRHPKAEHVIRVVPEGVDPRFRPVETDGVQRVREKLGLHQPYVLFVGTIEPRKNLDRLIRAFSLAACRSGLPHDLVIAGGRGWKDVAIQAALEASPVKGRIRFTGYVDDADMPALYAGADLFVFASLDEGFGLPPLEAMACGTAVVASRAGSLPEVLGEAARLVDPHDEEEIAAAVVETLGDASTRSALIAAGLERAARYDWNAAADATIAVYEEAAS